jgi:prepilin-type N-terminal cleavage/methylation domain-containing protein
MMRSRKGFTLIELLVVIVIIGMLAAIAIPKFSSVKAKGYKAQAISDLVSLRTAEETFFADSNRYAALSELETYSSTYGVGVSLISSSTSSWSATLTHPHLPGVVCGIAIAVPNPVNSGAGEGEPICK